MDHSVPGSKVALGETSWQFLWLVLVSIDLLECPVVDVVCFFIILYIFLCFDFGQDIVDFDLL